MKCGRHNDLYSREVVNHCSYYHFRIPTQITQISFRAIIRKTYKLDIPIKPDLKKKIFIFYTANCNMFFKKTSNGKKNNNTLKWIVIKRLEIHLLVLFLNSERREQIQRNQNLKGNILKNAKYVHMFNQFYLSV